MPSDLEQLSLGVMPCAASSRHYRHLGIENAIRPSALGKRNFLFIGHPEAGERSAVIYTLLGSCRRCGLNPFDYLKDLFTRLPAAKITQIKEFTPAAWAKAKDRLVLQIA
jgi:transposase